jgi:D-alanyl-D-alanine carboxypeptidase
VVLGGPTPTVRDKQMMAMFTQGFTKKMGTGTLLAMNGKPALGPAVVIAGAGKASAAKVGSMPASIAAAAPAVVATAAVAPVALAPAVPSPDPAEMDRAVAAVANSDSDALLPLLKPGSGIQLTDSSAPDPQAMENVWQTANAGYGVQVGAYSQYAPAQSAAVRVTKAMPTLFTEARIVIDQSNKLYRARVTGMTRQDAETACAKLKAQRADCMVFQSEDGLAKAN